MRIRLAGKGAARATPRSCFDLGRRVTEIGAALAYAEHFARRAHERTPSGTFQDVSSGLRTAAGAAARLKGDAPGYARRAAARLERDLVEFEARLRQKWTGALPVSTGDLVELQKGASEFRRRATRLWDDVRRACPPDGTVPKKKR